MDKENYLICAGTKTRFISFEEAIKEYGDTTEIIDQIPNTELKTVIKEILPNAKCTPVTVKNNITNDTVTAYRLENPKEVLNTLLHRIDTMYSKFKKNPIDNTTAETLAKAIYDNPKVRFTTQENIQDITIFEFLNLKDKPLIYDIFIKEP